jgi:hypothetical protein
VQIKAVAAQFLDFLRNDVFTLIFSDSVFVARVVVLNTYEHAVLEYFLSVLGREIPMMLKKYLSLSKKNGHRFS